MSKNLDAKLVKLAERMTAYEVDIDDEERLVISTSAGEVKMPLVITVEQAAKMAAMQEAGASDGDAVAFIRELAGDESADIISGLSFVTVSSIIKDWSSAVEKLQGLALGE